MAYLYLIIIINEQIYAVLFAYPTLIHNTHILIHESNGHYLWALRVACVCSFLRAGKHRYAVIRYVFNVLTARWVENIINTKQILCKWNIILYNQNNKNAVTCACVHVEYVCVTSLFYISIHICYLFTQHLGRQLSKRCLLCVAYGCFNGVWVSVCVCGCAFISIHKCS